MTDNIDKIKELREKHKKAQEAFAKAQAQIETLVEKREEIMESLKQEHGVDTIEEAEDLLNKLRGEQADLLQSTEKILDEIDL
ncbi:MAG: YidC/Oxa1 family membrane protein insertase [Candidatus Bathyarchaeota archaeon]|nr:YidC/Oxa1 family membrane protein insertase [Candidatus Bathyarchaeota archaeon]